jgi:MFS family permease
MLFPSSANASARRLLVAKALRSVADGYVSILLPAYLLELGLSAFRTGILATATLVGSAFLTLFAGLITHRFGHRRPLVWASVLMILTGLGFAGFQSFWPLLIVAFVGTLNPSSGDVSIFLPLEQSLLSQSVADVDRTTLLARYSLAGTLFGALGTLLAALPELAARVNGTSPLRSQMDVPTRGSYVMAVVTPPERAAAAAITSVPRSLAAAISPTIAGYLLTVSAFGWPLLIGGALKGIYDLVLLGMFQHVWPPEEQPHAQTRPSQARQRGR